MIIEDTCFVNRPHSSSEYRVAVDGRLAAVGQAPVVTVGSITVYYYHDDRRVAMRQGDVVYYLHTDHLRSPSLTTNASGDKVAETRYLPYGEERWNNGGAVSDFTFIRQRRDVSRRSS
jgi:hypothetical protein